MTMAVAMKNSITNIVSFLKKTLPQNEPQFTVCNDTQKKPFHRLFIIYFTTTSQSCTLYSIQRNDNWEL